MLQTVEYALGWSWGDQWKKVVINFRIREATNNEA
jgi:hypothetical protein